MGFNSVFKGLNEIQNKGAECTYVNFFIKISLHDTKIPQEHVITYFMSMFKILNYHLLIDLYENTALSQTETLYITQYLQ